MVPKTVGRYAQKQQSFKESVIAHHSRYHALKMDGAKRVTDTAIARKRRGRQATCMGRRGIVRFSGPCRYENPGGSRI